MAEFSNIDVEKVVVAWEEEEKKLKSFYSYLDLPFSALLVRHDRCAPKTFLRFIQGLVQQFLLTFLFFNNFIAAHSKIMDTVAITSSFIVNTIWCGKKHEVFDHLFII